MSFSRTTGGDPVCPAAKKRVERIKPLMEERLRLAAQLWPRARPSSGSELLPGSFVRLRTKR